jgi:DNA-binding NarL/FixJ family response regulator
VRVLVAEDSVLFREGLARLLREAGHEVIAEVGDADALLTEARRTRPDLCVVDVRMPPQMDSDGARAAQVLRQEFPGQPVLLLSQQVETRHSVELISSGACGYLLKDRVLRVDDFLDAVTRVAAGGTALDPEVVAALVAPLRAGQRLAALTARELEVLSLAAEGHSNAGIAGRLFISERTVETHMRGVFLKLGIPDEATSHRRVTAVVAYLGAPTSR